MKSKSFDSYWGFIAKNGYLYFNKGLNEEVEEDFFTIYKIRIPKS
jgi:hypothetical protein